MNKSANGLSRALEMSVSSCYSTGGWLFSSRAVQLRRIACCVCVRACVCIICIFEYNTDRALNGGLGVEFR